VSLNEKNLNKLIHEAMAIEAEEAKEADAIGFMARMLVQATMPHKKPEELAFSRQNGNFHMSIVGNPVYGLPYGPTPRLLLAWLTTEAVRTKERELILGDSLSSFMRQLGINATGGKMGTIGRFKSQTSRLFGASVSCTYNDEEQTATKNYNVAKEFHLWWQAKNPEQPSLWQSTVKLDQDFFEEIIERPVPVDMRALQALKGSPMALDIYSWLTYRMSYLKRSTEIPWQVLQGQFGASYAEGPQGTRNFKRAFFRQLNKINVVYPEANIDEGSYGLQLKPSKPHIAKAAKK